MDGDTPAKARKQTRLEDLAERVGVSISTVSRALNDHPAVNRRTKERIWEAARQMDYPFRRTMPAGPIGAQATIAVVVPVPQSRDDVSADPFVSQLLAGISAAARERDCDVLLSHLAPRNLDDLRVAVNANRAEGIVFVGQSFLRSELSQLAAESSNFVVWGAEFRQQDYCSIGSDNAAGGRRAAAHLLRLGRGRLVFLGDTQAPEAAQRHRGFLEAHDRLGLVHDEQLKVSAHFEVESAEAAVLSLFEAGLDFDGIVAASDLLALGAIRAALRSGRRVPDDLSVVGYDDIRFARLSRPALTTIRQDTHAAGRMLVSKLLDSRGQRALSERLPTDLIVRDSCGG